MEGRQIKLSILANGWLHLCSLFCVSCLVRKVLAPVSPKTLGKEITYWWKATPLTMTLTIGAGVLTLLWGSLGFADGSAHNTILTYHTKEHCPSIHPRRHDIAWETVTVFQTHPVSIEGGLWAGLACIPSLEEIGTMVCWFRCWPGMQNWLEKENMYFPLEPERTYVQLWSRGPPLTVAGIYRMQKLQLWLCSTWDYHCGYWAQKGKMQF